MTVSTSIHNPPWVSVIIPTLNEAGNLPYVLSRIPNWVHEILIVDGHSTDNTIEVVRQMSPRARILMQDGKGKGSALRQGFEAATGDIIVTLDADGSTDPAEIPAFVGILRIGADFVKGSRFLQGGGTDDMTTIRRWGNYGLMLFARLIFGGNFSDLCYGYNAFWSCHLPYLHPDVDGFEIETALNIRALAAGLRVAEVPSFEARRRYGESHLRAIPDGLRVLKTIMKERLNYHQNRPLTAVRPPEPEWAPETTLPNQASLSQARPPAMTPVLSDRGKDPESIVMTQSIYKS